MTMQLDCNKNLFAIHVLTKQIQERLLWRLYESGIKVKNQKLILKKTSKNY